MYTVDDFSELDKTNFKCFRFPNGDLYYGETAFINPANEIITDKVLLKDEETKKSLREVRHGNGAQLFGVSNGGKAKYEGTWAYGRREGKGIASFEDGSSYEGEFKNDLFEGSGKFVWRIGHVYIGNWKEGRMEGVGEFKHKDGHILKGTFVNNYIYDKKEDIFINPFLYADEMENFIEERRRYVKFLEDEKIKFTVSRIKPIYNLENMHPFVEESYNQNLTSFVVRTIDKIVDRREIFRSIADDYLEINLKEYYMKLRSVPLLSPESKQILTKTRDDILNAISTGKTIILNLDELGGYDNETENNNKENVNNNTDNENEIKINSNSYNALFFPSIKELPGGIESQAMFWPNVWKNTLENKYKKFKVNPGFRMVIYSGILIEVDDEEKVKELIETKFSKDIPLTAIRVAVYCKEKKPPEEVKPIEPVETVENPEKEKEKDKGKASNEKGNKKKSAKK